MTTTKLTTSAVSTVKLETIRGIEKTIQKQWAEAKIFEADAPAHPTSK